MTVSNDSFYTVWEKKSNNLIDMKMCLLSMLSSLNHFFVFDLSSIEMSSYYCGISH